MSVIYIGIHFIRYNLTVAKNIYVFQDNIGVRYVDILRMRKIEYNKYTMSEKISL